MMKRWLVFATATAVVAGVTGCGSARSHVAGEASPAKCTHARQAHPASPAEIAHRFLSRLGDRRYIRSITFPESNNGNATSNELVAVVNDPLAGSWKGFSESNPKDWLIQLRAHWEGALAFGAMRDDFCSAGGPQSLVQATGDGGESADVWTNFARRFRNPSPASFRARVARVGHRFGFHVVSLRLLHPDQIAPLLIVRTSRDRNAFADNVLKILDTLDPANPKPGAFEGFFFAAEDAHGPFVISQDVRRAGPEDSGYAANGVLFPTAHG
jgi:hypothetical protein